MLAQFPEEVQDPRILSVADVNRGICPRILQSKNCDKMTNCPYLHPDFMSGKWVVPDLICYKWFQGVCQYGGRCCNQHGGTFDDAMHRAVRAQQQLRRDRPPFSFDSVDGGTTRQVNPDDASRMISNSMTLYRLNTARNSRFGTNYTLYYEYDMWARSADARHVRADDEERRGGQRATSPVGCGRGTSPRRASSKAPCRPHTPMRASFPPARSATPTPVRYSDGPAMETESDGSSAPRFGAPRSSFRQGDAGEGVVLMGVTRLHRTTKRGLSPARRWIDAPTATPVIVEMDETPSVVPPPTVTPQVPDDEDPWNQCDQEVRQARDARGHADDPWGSERINSDIPETSRPATPPASRPRRRYGTDGRRSPRFQEGLREDGHRSTSTAQLGSHRR